VPAKNVKEFVALAKSKPGRINYASPGVGTVGHFGVEYLSYLTGIKMNMVPYKGAGPYVVDLIAGQIEMAFVQVAQAAPHVQAGRMRALNRPATRSTWSAGTASSPPPARPRRSSSG